MNLKLRDIIYNEESIRNIQKTEFPMYISFRIKQLVKSIASDVDNFHLVKNELIKKIGIYDKETDTYTVPKDKMEEFTKELESVLNADVNIDFEKIKVEDCGKVAIKPVDLVDWIFE